MDNTKYTKGKWEVNSYDEILVTTNVIYTNEGICRCFNRKFTGNKIEDKANSLLISKAPEMLEELKETVVDLKNLRDVIEDSSKKDQELVVVVKIVDNWISRKEQLLKEATEL